MSYEIVGLLILFQLKHFVCDYPLQGQYMLKKANKRGWFLPLLTHASVHAFGTMVILSEIKALNMWWLSLVDLFIHFTMDRIKASPSILNRWAPDKPYFWWALGFDQMVHYLTHYFIIWMLLK